MKPYRTNNFEAGQTSSAQRIDSRSFFANALKYAVMVASMVIFVFSTSSAQKGSQESYDDPLKKPIIWQKLKLTPWSHDLWDSYFGKDWTHMTSEENSKLRKWKIYLINKKREAEKAEGLDGEKELQRQIEEDRLKEALAIDFLKHNLHQNLVFIEEYYHKEFARLGQTYVYYAQKHPNQDFSKVIWIEEQDKKLKELNGKK